MTAARKPKKRMAYDSRYGLNAICPYFTMFPLEYPMRALAPARLRRRKSPIACDPYCGRGTTIFAARLRGIPVYGIDVAPVAVAIARAKLADTTVEYVMDLFDEVLEQHRRIAIPASPFWKLAFDSETLRDMCRVRAGLLNRRSNAATLLRAIMLGGLHGPRAKSDVDASYFSNQMPRTFAAKPDYAIRFWKRHRYHPPQVDVRAIVKKRTERALKSPLRVAATAPVDVQCADSRTAAAYTRIGGKITHVVTSPPYYGLRTYSQDQWLREWFLGGSDTVDYAVGPGLDHGSPEAFAKSLAQVWDQLGTHAADSIQLFIRFGGIRSRSTSAEDILRDSLTQSVQPWRIVTRHHASSANGGKRQALQMQTADSPIDESDYVVELR